jgi:hypothetical protein
LEVRKDAAKGLFNAKKIHVASGGKISKLSNGENEQISKSANRQIGKNMQMGR